MLVIMVRRKKRRSSVLSEDSGDDDEDEKRKRRRRRWRRCCRTLLSGLDHPAAIGRSKCSKNFHETFRGSCTKLFVTKIGILDQMTPPPLPLKVGKYKWNIILHFRLTLLMNLFFERYYDQLDMERSKNLINRTVSGQNLFWHSTLLGPAYLSVS